jgi:catechol 2,3-dioxygenase-like lactoylglutathione lyase family enzyme
MGSPDPIDRQAPEVDCDRHHPCLAVPDVKEAAEFYETKLGFRTVFIHGDPPGIAGVNLGRVQIFLERGTPCPSGCSVYFVVDDADALYDYHRSKGVEVACAIDDRPYALRDYTVKDLHGYRLSFGHNLFNAGPPIKIERVDVHLRLEKRLAGLLQDLAVHKRMSLDSCVEEILLHTNEPLGDGVASPHTKRTLAHIQDLKRKHGIDYDSHASYRFVE